MLPPQPNTLLTAVHKLYRTLRAALSHQRRSGKASGWLYGGCIVCTYSTFPMHSALLELLKALSVQLAVTEGYGL